MYVCMYVCMYVLKKSESEVAEMASVSAAFKASNSVEEFKGQVNATSLEEIARIYTTNWYIHTYIYTYIHTYIYTYSQSIQS